MAHSLNLRLLTWNLANGGRIAGAMETLAAQSADVLCFQEVDRWSSRGNDGDPVKKVCDGLGLRLSFFPSLQTLAIPIHQSKVSSLNLYGNAIATRGEIIETFGIDLGPEGTYPAFSQFAPTQERRTALICRILLQNRTITIVTTHLQFGDNSMEQRRHQARILGEVLSKLHDAREPVVVAGDFNAELGEVDDWGIFVNFLRAAMPKKHPGTYSSLSPRRARRQIDHVFVQGCSIAALHVVSRPQFSDHDMLVAEIQLASDPQ